MRLGKVSLGGVGWTSFAGIKGEELYMCQVYPVGGAEGVEFVAPTGENKRAPGLVTDNEDTRK